MSARAGCSVYQYIWFGGPQPVELDMIFQDSWGHLQHTPTVQVNYYTLLVSDVM